VSGETLSALAIRYYGASSKWAVIVSANSQLAGRRRAADGSPLIYQGDTLVIPDEDKSAATPDSARVKKTIALSDKERDAAIVAGGYRFLGFTNYEISLSYDSFDTFSFSAPFDIARREIAETLQPFSFVNCAVYYKDALMFKGTLLTPNPEVTASAKEITLQGYPLCGILNDCTIPLAEYPAEVNGLDLKQIADYFASAYGIRVVFDGDAGGAFTGVSVEPTEKTLDFLVKLSKQRSLLFTNDEQGRLKFFTAKETKPFVSFEEGKLPLISVKPQFRAQEVYSHIIGFTKTDKETDSAQYVYENAHLINKGISRCQTIIVDDAETDADLEAAVKAEAGRMFANCVSYELECEGHTNADGQVFQKGMTVAVRAPGAMINRETTFIARTVKLKRTTEGKTATLSLVLPGSFTGKIPEVLPWQ
jgi:prophage tail gpP-like protein